MPAATSCDLRLLAGTVLAWELVGAASGGSYWLHYLVATVPGLVLVVATLARHRPRRLRWMSVVLTYAAVMGILAIAALAAGGLGPSSSGDVERYLAAHARPGDTGAVAFGMPSILEAAHLDSPYPDLWSLEVRVRDPRLVEFTHVLAGPAPPTWVVVDGTSLATWGVDPTAAQPVLDREYHLVHTAGDWHVYHLDAGGSGASSRS